MSSPAPDHSPGGVTPGRVAIFGPHPLLTVTAESGNGAGDDIHLHMGGQGIWVARMAAELGAIPVLCGFAGGEIGLVLRSLLARVPWELRLVETAAASGCYMVDRRTGDRQLVAGHASGLPSRHELDDLVSTTCASALEADVLVVCNPYPAGTLPLELYGSLVADVRGNGTPVLVDLSSPRLDSALEGKPDLVKLNDWELAEYVLGPVATPQQMHAAASRLRDRGAGIVLVTRGAEPAFVLAGDSAWELTPPRFERGSREGCGDSMMGAIGAAWASGAGWQDAMVTGAAAGAANFLRHGLGTGSRAVVESLRPRVELREL
jgi:1-phosphofructokinase